MNNCDVILLACKFNSWCVPPFLHLYKKFCNDDIYLIAEQDYSTAKCSFLPLPNTIIVNGECPRNKFSDSLIYALENTPNKNAIIMLSDYFINNHINIDLLEKSIDYIGNNPNILRIDIGGQTKPNPFIQINDWLFECALNRDCFYPVSLCPGVWNKEIWLQLLSKGWDPWQTEALCYNKFLATPHLRSLWAEPSINYLNAMRCRDDANIFINNEEIYNEVKSFIPTRFKNNF